MDFIEVSSSKFKPFTDFLSMAQAKEMKIMPKPYWPIFEDRCMCGSEMMVRVSGCSITGVACCDPYCWIKLTYQLSEVFRRFGYKGIGKETCSKVVQDFLRLGKPFSLSDVLLRGDDVISLSGAMRGKWIEGVGCIKKSRQSFGTFIYKLSYPGVGSKFEGVLQGISSIKQLTVAVKQEGFFCFFANRGVRSFTTIYYFMTYLPDVYCIIKEWEDCISTSSGKILPVCLTGKMKTSIGRFTKSEYLALCSQILERGETFEIKSVESVSKALFIIVGEDSIAGNSAKYRQAVEKQNALQKDQGSNQKILFSPDEFVNMVLGKGGKCGVY